MILELFAGPGGRERRPARPGAHGQGGRPVGVAARGTPSARSVPHARRARHDHQASADNGNFRWTADHTEPIKVTVAEALTLQGFRPDYPVQGTKTKQFEQVGNAVPPLLARHVLGALVGAEVRA